MSHRRGQLDPFIRSRQARWLVVSVIGAQSVSVSELPPGSDLRQAFLQAVEEHRLHGWTIENEPTYPCVFVHRGRERRLLTILHGDPAGAGLAHFSPWRE